MIRLLLLLTVLLAVGPLAAQEDAPPDFVFFNGTVLTMERGEAQALAVLGDRVLRIGTDSEITALAGPDTVVIDLGGRTLMPGFVDPHTHILNDYQYLADDLDGAQELALQNGITTLGNLFTTPEFLEQLLATDLRIRTSAYLIYNNNCGDVIGDWFLAHPPTREAGEMLRIGGVKIFADGGTCGAPALSYQPGDLFIDEATLTDVIRMAQGAGHQVAIHALGDVAVETAQNAIAAALDGGPNVYRHRIDHNAVIRPEMLPRYSEIGIIPVIFGQYPVCDLGAILNDLPYQEYEWPWRALVDANPDLPIAWHGDDPWIGGISPLIELHSLVTFNEVAPDGTVCEAPAWLQSHAITVAEALPMMTINAAYALFREEEVGSLMPGKYADMIILSDNPQTVPSADLKDIQVLMTMVGGRIEYCADAALCGTATQPAAPVGAGQNLAASATVQASQAEENPASGAADGDRETNWNAGGDAPQWIQFSWDEPVSISALNLVPSQYPNGPTVHRIVAQRADESRVALALLRGPTRDGEDIRVEWPAPVHDITTLRIATLESPSWVAWFEVEIFAGNPDVPGACLITAPNNINLREGPGTTFETRTVLSAGDAALVDGQTTGEDGFVWYRLAVGAWARSDVVSASPSCQTVPPVQLAE